MNSRFCVRERIWKVERESERAREGEREKKEVQKVREGDRESERERQKEREMKRERDRQIEKERERERDGKEVARNDKCLVESNNNLKGLHNFPKYHLVDFLRCPETT